MSVTSTGVSDDYSWVKQAFFYPNNAIKNAESNARGKTYSSASLKYTDTTLGGNYSINPKPQFTRWADPKMPGLTNASKGMGEYYSTAIDDNAQRIFLQFGVPEYNSLTRFFGGFFDTDSARLANTGETGGFIFGAGKLAGFLFTLPLQPIIGITNLWNRVVSMASGKPYSKYYYLKPTMPLYWDTVSHIVNMIGVNMGLVEAPEVKNIKDFTEDEIASMKKSGLPYQNAYTASQLSVMQSMLPDIFKSNGGIDIYAISTRAQRLAIWHEKKLKEIGENSKGGSFEEFEANVMKFLGEVQSPVLGPKLSKTDDVLHGYLNNYYKPNPIGQGEGAEFKIPDISPTTSEDGKPAYTASNDKAAAMRIASSKIAPVRLWDRKEDYFKAGLEDGGQFLSMIVDYEGSVSESFSNSAKSSDIESMMNSTSSNSRSMNFNLAGGNLGDNIVSNTIESFMGGVKKFLQGALDGASLSGLSALGGAAYVTIPDFWESASANLPKSNYTMKLATPYGNKLSIYTNIYVPLAMLMAGALPRSTGKNSYTSPFLVRLHSKGRNVVRLGIIDSLSITRGTGGIGWSVDGLPTAVDVSFSILNLDKIMHVPITEQAGLSDLLSLSMFDEDTVLTDYLSVLGSQDLYSQLYAVPKLRLAWRRQLADFNSWMEPSRWATHFSGGTTGRMLSAIYRGSQQVRGR